MHHNLILALTLSVPINPSAHVLSCPSTGPPTCSPTVTPAVLWDHFAVLAIIAIIGTGDNYTASTHQAGLLRSNRIAPVQQ